MDDAALPPVTRALERVCGNLATAGARLRLGILRAQGDGAEGPGVADGAGGARDAGGGGPVPPVFRGSATASLLGSVLRLLALVLVVLIVVGAVSTMLRGTDPGEHLPAAGSGAGSAPSGTAAGPVEPTAVVGPLAGDSAAEYLAIARSELESLARAAPATDLYAVVSLAGYRTPTDLRQMFAAYRLTEVFFRVPPDGADTSATVRDPVADIEAAFDSAADTAETRVHEATGAADAEAANRAAVALRARCACLFAAVVRAPAARLLELTREEQVRVVDPAPPGLMPPAVSFVPLEPERT
ncbi:hypothetical protein UG55_1005152 [Frankia sp. EI5c]|uniref:hypothetical protein n=1 Tax=Frankia sp. EI5c TaxID=683316 RepID=UPI0007C23959|nr:hypothetical protein [Frankia sp. EI5c]OAA28638.1 hypothetical protein UG55_1005152 [Frankia sp. EI5c]